MSKLGNSGLFSNLKEQLENQEKAQKQQVDSEKINSLLSKARKYCKMGTYDRALQLCNEADELKEFNVKTYITYLCICSENFTIYEGKEIERYINNITKLDENDEALDDDDYCKFIENRNKALKEKPAVEPKKEVKEVKKKYYSLEEVKKLCDSYEFREALESIQHYSDNCVGPMVKLLADFYSKGICVKKDEKKAKELYEKARDLGEEVPLNDAPKKVENKKSNVLSLEETKRIYHESKGNDIVDEKLLLKSVLYYADQNNIEMLEAAGHMFTTGVFNTKINTEKGFLYLKKAYDAVGWYGLNLSSVYDLAECYRTRDISQAIFLYEKCYENSPWYTVASKLGEIYENNLNDHKKALEWYKKGADLGGADCKKEYERLNKNSDILTLEETKSEYSKLSNNKLTKAQAKKVIDSLTYYANQGDNWCQCSLGFCYDFGYNVIQNPTEAVKWYKKAAEQGNASAQCNLGYCYEQGTGVTKDTSKAFEWYKKAAEQGNAIAQSNLGTCYEYGTGVAINKSKALEWYKKAANQGYARGKEKYDRLLKKYQK